MKKSETVAADEINVFKSYFECIKKYCHFRGRINRCNYWSFVLVNFIIGVMLGYMEGIQGRAPVLSGAYSLFMILPSLAAQFRRLHDVNKSGWYLGGLLIFLCLVRLGQSFMSNGQPVNTILENVVSVIIIAWVLVLLFFYIKKGDKKENKYGTPQE